MKKFWRIGCTSNYFNDTMKRYFEKYPFVWGGGVSGTNGDGTAWRGTKYPNFIKDVSVGDILVAGGTTHIKFIGRILAPPAFIKSENNTMDEAYYNSYNIEKETDVAVINEFIGLNKELIAENAGIVEDVICFKVAWFKLEDGLKFQTSPMQGGFQPIDRSENIEYITKKIEAFL